MIDITMSQMRKMYRTLFYVLHASIVLFGTSLTLGDFIDYSEPTAVIQQRAGYDIKLQCGLGDTNLYEAAETDVQFNWFFKQCGESVAITCNNFQNNDWTQLPCEENFCQSTLLLRNVTEKYSGLYKCLRLPYRAEFIDIGQRVRIYQLDVRSDHKQLASLPEFTESLPTDKTASIGSQVVFQCPVRSEVHPSIKWFRRIPEFYATVENGRGIENFSGPIVKHNGHTYELLQSSPEKLIGDDIYLSKLLLSDVHLKHAGYYACVAINYRGHIVREAYLSVYTGDINVGGDVDKEYWSDYDEELGTARTDPKQFVLLFLMPLGLAMLPAVVWLCYVMFKRCRRDTEHNADPEYFREETMTTETKSMLRHA